MEREGRRPKVQACRANIAPFMPVAGLGVLVPPLPGPAVRDPSQTSSIYDASMPTMWMAVAMATCNQSGRLFELVRKVSGCLGCIDVQNNVSPLSPDSDNITDVVTLLPGMLGPAYASIGAACPAAEPAEFMAPLMSSKPPTDM